MPFSIQCFVWLSVAQTVISVGGAPFGPPNVRTARAYGTSAGIVMWWAVLIWLIAWQQAGWARWVVAALIALCIPGFLFIAKSYRSQYPIFTGAQFVSMM